MIFISKHVTSWTLTESLSKPHGGPGQLDCCIPWASPGVDLQGVAVVLPNLMDSGKKASSPSSSKHIPDPNWQTVGFVGSETYGGLTNQLPDETAPFTEGLVLTPVHPTHLGCSAIITSPGSALGHWEGCPPPSVLPLPPCLRVPT